MRTFVAIVLILSFVFQPIVGKINLPIFDSSGMVEDATIEENLTEETADSASIYSETVVTQTEEEVDTRVRISLQANPQLIIPGTDISVEYTIDGWENALEVGNLQTIFNYPTFMQASDIRATMTEEDTGMQMEVTPLSATRSTTFTFDSSQSEDSFLIDVALNSGGETLASNSILMTTPSLEATVGKKNFLVSQDGRVQLDFPKKALSESLYLDVRYPSPSSIAGYSLSGNPVEVVAVGQDSRQNVEQFDEEFTLTIKYDLDKLYGGSEDDLMIYYYDESIRAWYPIETTIDKNTQTISAQVDHLTVFDYKAESWQAATVPTLSQAQVNGSTGAATYDMSFWVPSAQGGFSPSLKLSYNSQVIDSSTAFTQASWVGSGWSLDLGYIERNMNETNSDLTDDTFQLVLNGVGSRLLPIRSLGNVTSYVTEDMNYWDIQFDSSANSWMIKDQTGTTYVFAVTTKTNPTDGCVDLLSELTLTWRWSLSAAIDKFNNTITYSYETDVKSGCANQIAVYPSTITYPNNAYRISFSLETRQDYGAIQSLGNRMDYDSHL